MTHYRRIQPVKTASSSRRAFLSASAPGSPARHCPIAVRSPAPATADTEDPVGIDGSAASCCAAAWCSALTRGWVTREGRCPDRREVDR